MKSHHHILIISLLCLLIMVHDSFSQPENETRRKLKLVADAVLIDAVFEFADESTGERFTSTADVPAGTRIKPASAYNDWRYWNGVLNISILKIASALNNPDYEKFVLKNLSFCFENYKWFERNYKGEGKWNYPFAQKFITEELDDCGAMGASVIEVYKLNPQPDYREYINQAADHILRKQTRLKDKTFVRSFPYKWTLWADDLYMGISFLSRMGNLTGDKKYFNDAITQVINFHKYLFDETAGLMHHFRYMDLNKRGNAFWGRANGWALLAQTDLLDQLDKNHPKRNLLLSLLQKHLLGISRYQGASGLWHQLLDKPDSYEETSCTAMFTYAVARAVNKGYIDARYATIAKRGWEGVMSKIREDGLVQGVCTGTVTSDDLVHYYNRPAPLNDVHGIGTVILAGAEMLLLK